MAVGRDRLHVNDAWIAVKKDGSPEDQLPPKEEFYVRVEAEAGSNAWASGEAYTLRVILRDLTNSYANVSINSNPVTVIQGHLNAAGDDWKTQDNIFTIGPVKDVADGTLLRVEAALTSGVTGQGIDVFEGDYCMVTA